MKNFIYRALIFTLMVSVSATALFASNSGGKKQVLEAYELRMNGKADEALFLLESVLTEDSTVAMAHYEMARTKHYMLVGGGSAGIDDVIESINRAVTYEPENIIYAYYNAIVRFLHAYMAMRQGPEEVKSRISESCQRFEKVLEMKPDYHEARMYLVEIYGKLPPEMGGDSARAAGHAEKLIKTDVFFGAMAKAALAAEDFDQPGFWKDALAADSRNPLLMKELGKAYLYEGDPATAEKYFEEARKADPANNILVLNLARYHMMTVRRNRDLAGEELPLAKKFIEKYLSSTPGPLVPLKAYAKGLLVIIERFSGNQAEAEKLQAEATSLDPYFSKASGLPEMLLFVPPDKIVRHYSSFFRPF